MSDQLHPLMRRFLPKILFDFGAVSILIFLCLETWYCFTSWGLIVSSISAQIGTASDQTLAAERLRALRFFWLMGACQLLMVFPAVWLVGRKRDATSVMRSFLRLSNWLIGLALVLLTDALVFGALLTQQMARSGR